MKSSKSFGWSQSGVNSPSFYRIATPYAECQIQLNLMMNEVDSSLKFTVLTVGTKHLLTSQVYELWTLQDSNLRPNRYATNKYLFGLSFHHISLET